MQRGTSDIGERQRQQEGSARPRVGISGGGGGGIVPNVIHQGAKDDRRAAVARRNVQQRGTLRVILAAIRVHAEIGSYDAQRKIGSCMTQYVCYDTTCIASIQNDERLVGRGIPPTRVRLY